MDFDNHDDHISHPYRGCQIGACFACGLGAGPQLPTDNNHGDHTALSHEWQRNQPNPLPTFPRPDEFYTPILLPGVYLPLEFISATTSEKLPFYRMDDPELAKRIAAFLDHELTHRHLLFGVVPMIMRLITSRCYAQIALLTKRFRPSRWEDILSQSANITHIYNTIAPLHEVVATLAHLATRKDNPYAFDISEESVATYTTIYGTGFEGILNDFRYIIERLGEWFAPCPIHPFTLYALAEFMLVGALDSREIRADLFTSPSLVPKRGLPRHLLATGSTYFDLGKQPPPLEHWHIFTYTAHDITNRLEAITLGIQKARPARSKKPLDTDLDQLIYVARAIPRFHAWLQRLDTLSWLKRRVLDGISDMEDMIRGHMDSDLALVEAWQSDISPYISIVIPNKSTDKVRCINYGMLEEPFASKMGEQLREEYRQELQDLSKHAMSFGGLIMYCLQSDRRVGVWYGPSFDTPNEPPITPTVRTCRQKGSENEELVVQILDVTIFESLREQIAFGEGVNCPLRHQRGNRCCGRAALMWSIYEAGLQAIDELGWQPTWWVEPECNKLDNTGFQEADAQRTRLEAICEKKDIDRYQRISEALGEFVRHGQVGNNGFYVVFRTDGPGVKMPEFLRSKYPVNMTIIVQHQFWDLSLRHDGFDITLSFEGTRSRLFIPFSAIITFLDERQSLDYYS